MQKLFLAVIGIFLILFFTPLFINAQPDADKVTPYRIFKSFTNPPQTGFRPVGIGAEEANSESLEFGTKIGFTYAFFAKTELTELLNQANCVGVRFYNVIESRETGVVSLIAVGILANGTELNGATSKKYFLSRPIVSNIIRSLRLEYAQAYSYAANAYQSESVKSFNVFISKSDLNSVLNKIGTIGLKVTPGSRMFQLPNSQGTRSCYTVMVIGINNQGSEIGTTSLKSVEPCPTICPNDNVMLSPANY